MRKENSKLQQNLHDLAKKLSRTESDKREWEKKAKFSASAASGPKRLQNENHVRSQIPLVGGRSPLSPAGGHHVHGESLVKVRLLEQENERLLRKIRALEQQLSELELLHGKRVQELLQVNISDGLGM